MNNVSVVRILIKKIVVGMCRMTRFRRFKMHHKTRRPRRTYKRRTCKSVLISNNIKVILINSCREMDQNTISSLWYTKQDFAKFTAEFIRDLNSLNS